MFLTGIADGLSVLDTKEIPMSGSLNKVTLIGNLAREPEVRTFDNGNKVCNLRLITSESWTDKNGDRQQKTEGHSLVIFNERLIETAEKYLKKGDKIYIEGQIRTRKYTDKDGNDKYVTEIELPKFNAVLTMLGGKSGEAGGDAHYDSPRRESGGDQQSRGGGRDDNRSGGRDDNRSGGRDSGNARQADRGNDNRGGFADDLDDDVPF